MAETENKQVKNNRQLLTERLQGRYPDKKFEEDDEIYGQVLGDLEDYDKNLAGYQEREKAFSDMFTGDPRSARFMTDWRNGQDPVVGLVRLLGTDIKDAIDDPAKQEAIAEANKEYLERVAKSKELEEQYQSNLSASLAAIDKMQAERSLSDDDVDAAMRLLVSIINDGIVGKVSPESIELALKAIHHDADVTAANEEGVVQGKNTKIEEKLRKPKQGDGTASLDGSNGAVGGVTPRRNIGALGRYGDSNKTIWERGGECRSRANA